MLAVGVRPAASATVEAALGSLVRRGAKRLDLVPLSVGQVATLLRYAGADPATSELVRAATGGNPMFVSELARHLAAGGSLDRVPSTLAELLRAEMRRLKPAARDLAAVCAVLDGEIDPGMALVVAGAERLQFDDLVAAGFLVEQGPAYRFRHDTIREAIRAGMSSSERARLDAAIASEALARNDRQMVAVHGCRAGATWDPEVAHAAAVEVSRDLASRFNVEAAARTASLARSIRRLVSLSPEARLDLEVADGETFTAAGLKAESRDVLRQAAVWARRMGDATALARIALVFGLGYEHGLARDSEVLALLHEALESLPESAHAARARILSRLAWQELQRDGIPAREALSAAALAEARMSEDPGALAAALNARCWGLSTPEGLEERRAAAREAWAAARDDGDVDLELGALMWVFRSELEAGNVLAAREAADAFDAITTRSPLPYHRWYAYLFRGTLALVEGRFEDARRLAGEIDPLATTQPEQAETNAVALTDEIAIASGPGSRLHGLRHLHDYLEGDLELAWIVRPHLRAIEAGPVAGRVALAQSMETFRDAPVDEDWLSITTALAAAAILCADAPVAQELFERLLPYETRWSVIANGASCRGPVAGYLAGLASVLGRNSDADAFRERAANAIRSTGARGMDYWMSLEPLAGTERTRGTGLLTAREAEVLALVARGHTNQEIAEMLVLSVRTVQRHVENVYGRLGLHSRATATLAAVEMGLVSPRDVRESRDG